jgi:short-subunit dehydrogenase
MTSHFRDRYGPWALVAGASYGIGLEFARSAARRGLSVAVVARGEPALHQVATELRTTCGFEAASC